MAFALYLRVMSEPVAYPPGTPCWVDLSTSDVDAATGFYGALFGWDFQEAGPVEETGGYRIITLNGASVGGLAPAMNDDQPTAWSTYVATSDADATARAVEEAGGQVMFGPMDVMDAGRMALFTDAAGGAFFACWQPGSNRGAQAVNRVGALAWNELDTREWENAARFYGAVFGWEAEPIEQEGQVVYVSLKHGGRLIGGMLPMGEEFPPAIPANWLAYFGLEDLDAAAGQVERLGGSVLVPRREMPQGAFAVFSDPQGGVFAGWQGSYDPPPGQV